jgi:hypothetical protein
MGSGGLDSSNIMQEAESWAKFEVWRSWAE